MKRKRFEWLFAALMIVCSYMVIFMEVPVWWKALCMTLYAVIIINTVLALWLENRPAQTTLLWTYILILLPVLGYIFYIYSGQLLVKGELFKSKRISDRELFEALDKKQKKLDLSNLNDHQRSFASYLEKVTLTDQNQNTKTKILRNGNDTFEEIKRQLRKARNFIHLEYYIFRYDRLGQELIDILKAKVKEGVEVRLLFDAAGSFSLSKKAMKKMLEAGINVRPFLPLNRGWYNQKFNFRNHRKIIVIDGKVGFSGGLNVGIEYLGEDDHFGFWCDSHVVLEGEAVQTLHAVFLLDWKYATGEILFENDRYLRPVPVAGDGLVHVVATGPETRDMSDHYYAM